MERGKQPYMLIQRLGGVSPSAKLALAVIQQAIEDSNYRDSDLYDATQYRGRDGIHQKRKVEHTNYVTGSNYSLARAMRANAREWLQSGEWQRTTDVIGIDRTLIIEYLIRNCAWYKI